MKRKAKIAGLGAALALGGLLIAWSGAVPLAASSGHWAITEWFLHYTMRRTVKVRSSTLKVPALEDPGRVLLGAGHYETGCRPCHGAPGAPQPVVLRNMTPRPPSLPERIPHWEPEELFWIVKHGIKLTGMPGWPVTERDDEVWSMVAFLLEIPQMSLREYQRLAQGGRETALEGLGEEPPEPVLESCRRCHGASGLGRAEIVPRLAGQKPDYLHASLEAYAEGRRRSGIMQPVAAALSPETMRDLARYYASLSPPPPEGVPGEPAEASERGRSIAARGIPETRVPSCSDCHGPGELRRKPIYPRLAGQHRKYLVQQLELFQKGIRGGTAYSHLMHPVASRLSAEEMNAVASYYASLRE